ncbi:hypothetical protein [Stenotrophomonas maltophilia]|uniref:hypothetical protein n=1 Tax=Stenotrophomonas maltophilia TaxID=40324 RepID=UPI001C12F3CF|nr:hypothetical protein [Stenotrophomonas maltophilia]
MARRLTRLPRSISNSHKRDGSQILAAAFQQFLKVLTEQIGAAVAPAFFIIYDNFLYQIRMRTVTCPAFEMAGDGP